jgi:hypothetical protein
VNDHGHLQEGVGALQEQTTRNKTSRHASSSSVSSPATRANMYGCWSSRSPTRMPYFKDWETVAGTQHHTQIHDTISCVASTPNKHHSGNSSHKGSWKESRPAI